MRISGMDALDRTLREVQSALADLDGDVAELTFDPHDPQSIELAIQQLFSAVDQRLSAYAQNQIVMGIGEEFKEAGRNAILERAAAARLAPGDDE